MPCKDERVQHLTGVRQAAYKTYQYHGIHHCTRQLLCLPIVLTGPHTPDSLVFSAPSSGSGEFIFAVKFLVSLEDENLTDNLYENLWWNLQALESSRLFIRKKLDKRKLLIIPLKVLFFVFIPPLPYRKFPRMFAVPDRRKETFLSIIGPYIERGSIIMWWDMMRFRKWRWWNSSISRWITIIIL